jgi:dTMP kinase
VVIEGLDGAGSTTQAGLLCRRLSERRTAYLTYEPSDGPAGLQVRLVLEHRVRMGASALAALFAADRMDHLYHRYGEGGIVARLRQGQDVVSDRYYLSSFAYQAMTVDWNWIWDMHAHCIRPEATVFIDVPVEVCLERIAAGRGGQYDLFENRAALTRVRSRYLRAIDRLCDAGDTILIVDGTRTPAEVHDAIWRALNQVPGFSVA